MGHSLDHDAFTRELVAVQRRLYAYILTILPNLTDADDVLQETNTTLLQKRKKFTAGTEFGAWACRVAYFKVLALRKNRQRERGHFLFADQSLLDNLATEAGLRFTAGDEAMLSRLVRCVEKLSPLHRQLIRLRYGSNILSEQIAKNLGRSASAVRQLLYRIRTRLLKCMQDDATTEEEP